MVQRRAARERSGGRWNPSYAGTRNLPVSNLSRRIDSWEEIRGFAINITAVILGCIGEFPPPPYLAAGSALIDEAVIPTRPYLVPLRRTEWDLRGDLCPGGAGASMEGAREGENSASCLGLQTPEGRPRPLEPSASFPSVIHTVPAGRAQDDSTVPADGAARPVARRSRGLIWARGWVPHRSSTPPPRVPSHPHQRRRPPN
jgi:hypothetical protein